MEIAIAIPLSNQHSHRQGVPESPTDFCFMSHEPARQCITLAAGLGETNTETEAGQFLSKNTIGILLAMEVGWWEEWISGRHPALSATVPLCIMEFRTPNLPNLDGHVNFRWDRGCERALQNAMQGIKQFI